MAGTWKFLYQHTAEYQSRISESGDPGQELPHVAKLLHAIEQVLQDSDAPITPRSAAARLSAGKI